MLNLSYNQISRFEVGWRINWLGLETLDLSFNNFSGNLGSSSLNFLKHNPGEFKINLTENYIVNITIDKKLQEEKIEENFVKIDVSNNPIVCSCNAYYFASSLNKLDENAKHLTLTGLSSRICTESQIETLGCYTEPEEWRLDIIVTLITIISVIVVILAVSLVYWKTRKSNNNEDFDKELFYSVMSSFHFTSLETQGKLHFY